MTIARQVELEDVFENQGAQEAVARMLGSLEGDERTGAKILHRALEEPIRQIAANAGADGSIVISRVRDGGDGVGFNALTGEYEDMISAGVADPTMVSRSALENAASIAGLFLTTEATVVDKPEEEEPMAHAGHDHGMGGMGGMGGMM